MAKVSFNKLGLKVNINEVPVQIGEETIAVKQYLPIEEKLQLISRVLEQAHDIENNFANPVKTDVYMILEIIEAYTNISFTEKQKEDSAKLYDLIVSSGLWDIIFNELNKEDYGKLLNYIEKSIKSFFDKAKA